MNYDMVAAIVILVSVFMIGVVAGVSQMGEYKLGQRLQKEAVSKGYACYNSTNGVWQWK